MFLCATFLTTGLLPILNSNALANSVSANFSLSFQSGGNMAITPEGNWVNDPIPVPASVTITQVDLSIGVTHNQPQELQFWLVSPGGAVWALVPWTPWGGQHQAFNLNNFNGQNSQGNWHLWMIDNVVNGVTGTEDYCIMTVHYTLVSDIVNPAIGATISGNYLVSVSTSSAASVRLFVDDQWVSDMTFNIGTGHWEYTLATTAFPDGAHTVTAIAHDPAGNEIADGHPVVFDNWNIYASFHSPAWGSSISGWTWVTAWVPDYAARGELYMDGDLVGVTTTVSGGLFGIMLYTGNYRDGSHNLRWIAYDPDGHPAAATEPVTIDNYAISCSMATPAEGSIVSGATNVAADVPWYAQRGELYIDGTFLAVTTTQAGGQFTFTLDTTAFPDGTHVLTVQAYDPDGNSAVGSSAVKFNNFGMFCSIVSPGTGFPLAGSEQFWVNVPSFSTRGELYVDGELYAMTTSLTNFGAFYYFGFTLETKDFRDGNHRVKARSYDQWGDGAAQTLDYVFDNYNIYVLITDPGAASSVSGTVLVNASVPPESVRGELFIDDGPVDVQTTISGGQYQFSVDTTKYKDGIHHLRVVAYDPDGNSALADRAVAFDNWNITVFVVDPIDGATVSGDATVTADVPAYATLGELYVDDALQNTTYTLDAPGRYGFILNTTAFPDGTHRLKVAAYDPDGNQGVATANAVFDNWQVTAAFSSPVQGGTISGIATASAFVPAYAVKGELYVDSVLVATQTTVASGQYTFTFDTTAFPDGYHALGVRVYDPDGNFAADTRSVLVDNYQIYCAITAPAPGESISGSCTVTAAVPNYTSRGELLVDGASYATTASVLSGELSFTLDTRSFRDGNHDIQVVAYDPDGNSASSTVVAAIDNYNISVSIFTFPGGSSVSGTLTVFGIVPDYSTRGELFVNDELFTVLTARNFLGWYQTSLDTTRFPDGAYRLKIIAYDPDGNSAVATAYTSFDNYKLPATFVNLPNSLSGKDASVTVSVPSYASKGELYVDGIVVATATSRTSGNYVFSFDTTAFRDGEHTLTARVFDPFSNYAQTARSVAIDNYNMTVRLVTPASYDLMSDNYTVRASVPSYSVRGELYVDGALSATTNSPVGSEYQFTLDTKTLKDGLHSVMVAAYDPDGNSGSDTVTAEVDNYQISATLLLVPGGTRISGTVAMYCYVPSYATRAEFYIDDNLFGTDLLMKSLGGRYYFSFSEDTTTLRDGIHIFRAVAYDPDGNAAVALAAPEVDNWQIWVSISSPAADSVRSGTVEVDASVPDYAQKGELYVGGAFSSMTTTMSGGMYIFSLDTRTVADGWHSIGVRAYDPDGESAFASVSVQLDNSPPKLWNVTVIYPAGQTAVKAGDVVSIDVQSEDAAGGSGLSGVWMNASNLGGGSSEMLDDGLHNDSSSLDGVFGSGGLSVNAAMGLHFLFITATDRAGNTATATAKVAVDTHNPLITNSYCVYPPGQEAAKFQDQVRVVSKVIDTRMTVDTVLVMDTSGSMSGTPISDARTAAKTFIGLMGEHDRAAIYSFNGQNLNTSKQEVSFTSDKATLNSTIDGLSAVDWTPLYDTVYTAIQYAKTSANMPVVIVLTDGNDVTGNDGNGNQYHSAHSLSDCENASIPVYTIGLDPGPFYDPLNDTVLKLIAQTSDGGSYYHAPSSSQLQQIYQDLAGVVEKMDVGGIAKVYCDATTIGGPSYVAMYDDGGHDDLGVGDGYFGSEYISVGSSSTAAIDVTTYALDDAGNTDSDTASVLVDNTPPALTNLAAKYRPGQWWAADGDSIHFVAKVVDTGAVGGMDHVELDASAIGGPASVRMVDDGTGHDAKANDGNWTSEDITVATGSATRFYTFTVTGWDDAANSGVQSGNVFIDNGRPLSINITTPASGQFVEGLLTVRVQATDVAAIASIELALQPAGTTHKASYDGLTGYYEYNMDTTGLSDGNYTFVASGLDIAGRSIPEPARVPFFVDNHPPGLKLNAPHDRDFVAGLVTIDTSGTTDVFLSAVEYSVDGTAWVTTYSPWDTAGESDGPHTVEVRAVDLAGHVSRQSITVVVDNTNPTCRIVAPGDGDILEGRVTLSVKAADAVGITRVDLSGGVNAEAEYDPQSGYYEYSLDTREMADGNYSLDAAARDDSGRTTSATGIGFRVDNHVPSLTVMSPNAYDYVYGMVVIQLNSSDGPFTDGLTVEYRVDERGWLPMFQGGDVWTAVWNSSAFGDGGHTLEMRSTDRIGHEAQQAIRVTADNHAPLCQLYSPIPGQYVEGKQLFQVLATDDVGIENVTLSITAIGDFLMSFNGYTGYYEYSLMSSGFPDGSYNATITALDRSGKATVAGPVAFHIDNIPPSFVLVRPKDGDAISERVSVEVRWTAGRSSPQDARVTYRIDSGAWTPADQNTSVAELPDGTHTVTVRAEDPAGHDTDISVRVFIDKIWPELSVVSPSSGVHVNDVTELRVRAHDEAGLDQVTVGRGNETPEQIFLNGATGFYEYGIDLSGLPDSRYNFTVTAYDVAGHATVSNLTIVYDTTGPLVTVRSPGPGGDRKGQIKFSVSATDPSGVSKVRLRFKGGDWLDMRLDPNGYYVYTWDTSVGDDGAHTVEISAIDRLNNEAVSTYDLSVRNYQANILAENFDWLLLLVLIVGFMAVTYAVLRRPRLPPQYLEALRLAAAAPARPTSEASQVPPTVTPPEPVQAPAAVIPHGKTHEAVFEDEEEFLLEGSGTRMQWESANRKGTGAPAGPPALGTSPTSPQARPSGLGFSLWGGRKTAPAASGGGTGASLAAATGAGPSQGMAAASPAPTTDDTGFEEVEEDGSVEEVKMEAWMPSGSLPPAQEMPRPVPVLPSTSPQPAPTARPPMSAPASSGDMWEEEEETPFYDESPPAPSRPTAAAAPARSPVPAAVASAGTKPPQSRGVSPLELLRLQTTKVTRTGEERKRQGPPPGWSVPRPAELAQEAPPPPPPAKPRASDGVLAPVAAVKPVPPGVQKLTPNDREKMGAMLDDLLTRSRKK